MSYRLMNSQFLVYALAVIILFSCAQTNKLQNSGIENMGVNDSSKFRPLFQQEGLQGWTAVNSDHTSWKQKNQVIEKSDNIKGYLRTDRPYTNYTIEYEQFETDNASATGMMVAATALPAAGSSYPDGIMIKSAHEGWKKYTIESKNGFIRILIDGRQHGKEIKATRKQGFICLLGDSTNKRYRNIRIRETNAADTGNNFSLLMETDFKSLYSGNDLREWVMKPGHSGHWSPQNWVINYDGLSTEKDKCLWSKKSYRDFILIADVRLTRKPSLAKAPVILPNGDNALNADGSQKEVDELYAGDTGIYLRGNSKSQINIGYRYIGSGEIYGYRVDKSMPAAVRSAVTPKIKADNPPGEWNRFIVTVKGDRVTVELNGKTVIDNAQLPGIPQDGPIALQDDHANNNTFQFANLFIKEI